jgi:hypothetical protein
MDIQAHNEQAKTVCSEQLSKGEITEDEYEWLTGDRKKPMFLVPYPRKGKRKSIVHLFRNGDTLCRMASTGGLNMDNYHIEKKIGERKICSLCASANI